MPSTPLMAGDRGSLLFTLSIPSSLCERDGGSCWRRCPATLDPPPHRLMPSPPPLAALSPLLRRHDDDVSKSSSKVVLGLSDAFRNPNGCKVPVTW